MLLLVHQPHSQASQQMVTGLCTRLGIQSNILKSSVLVSRDDTYDSLCSVLHQESTPTQTQCLQRKPHLTGSDVIAKYSNIELLLYDATNVIKTPFLHILSYLSWFDLVFQLGSLYRYASMALIIQNEKKNFLGDHGTITHSKYVQYYQVLPRGCLLRNWKQY